MSNDTKVWFITGCSTGFGRELARLVLARGDRAVVTARGADRVADLVADSGGRGIAVDLDVADSGQIAAAVAAATGAFGRVDVLVNNAGYGYQAAIEEGEEDEIRAMFDANVFGLFALTRAVLPVMRAQGSGHIVNITSVAGLIGFASSGYYSATKHAVEGFSDSLRAECAPLGIKVTCVAPGPFRTDWAGRSLRQTPNRIEAYAATAGDRMKSTSGYSGNQPGDPVRAGHAIIALTEEEEAPRHMVLGRFGVDAVTERMRGRLDEIESRRDAAIATDFPDAG